MNENLYDEQLFTEFFGAQPQAFVWLEPVWDNESQQIIDFIYTYSNDIGLTYLNLKPEDLKKVRISNNPSLTDAMRTKVLEEMIQAYNSNEKIAANIYNPSIDRYARVFRHRFRGGVLTIIQDSTEENVAIKQLEAQKAFANSILDATLDGIFAAKAICDNKGEVIDFLILRINPQFTRLLSLTEEQAVGQTLLSLFPSAKESRTFDFHCQVYNTGIPAQKEMLYRVENKDTWYNVSSVKLDDGILVTFTDITAQKQSVEAMKQQKNLLDNILQQSSNGISVTKVIRDEGGKPIDVRTILANDAAVKFIGLPKELYLSKTALELDPTIIESPFFQMCMHTLASGTPVHTQFYLEITQRWLEISVSRMDADHIITIFTDITPTKEIQLKIEEASNRLSAVFNAAQSGLFTFAPVRNSEGDIVDFRFVITNPAFAAYVHQTPEVLNGALGSTYFPGYLTNGVFDMYKYTYETGETQRKEINYNTDGLDIFLDLMSTKVGNEVLVTFTDFTPLKRAQVQLERSIEELKRANVNLEEFTYAASHDLQEPLRKIFFFSNQLRKDLQGLLDEDKLRKFERIESAAQRMHTLIEDLLTYSHTSVPAQIVDTVNLNHILQEVLQDMEISVQEKGAVIDIADLPVIKGNQRQLKQLFQNLISNSLKYSKPDVPPEIIITSTQVTSQDVDMRCHMPDQQQLAFYEIQIKDNGIGFEQEQAERIFKVFQRLHGKTEYAGTGIGLAIVRKVVESHQGCITADGQEGRGATFTIYFPVPENV